MQWPTQAKCPQCLLADGAFNEAEVANELAKFYGPAFHAGAQAAAAPPAAGPAGFMGKYELISKYAQPPIEVKVHGITTHRSFSFGSVWCQNCKISRCQAYACERRSRLEFEIGYCQRFSFSRTCLA